MDVVLINSPIFKENNKVPENEYLPPFGLGYIASNLIKGNLEVVILDSAQQGISVNELRDELHKLSPKVIGINIFTINIDVVKIIIESCEFNTRFIVGGQCTKYIYKDIIDWKTVNEINVVIGEGDFITKDIILEKVIEKPIIDINNRKVFKVDSTSCYFPMDLENSILNRKILNETSVKNYYDLKEKSIIASRGCAYDCAFCGAAKGMNKENVIRILSPQFILSEINQLISEDSSIECIRVLDDLFLRNEKSFKDAITIFNSVGRKWRAMAHVKSFCNISDEYLVELKNSGCIELFIGVESGADRIRVLINKIGTVDEVKTTINRILKVGINVKGYFIFGFPTETEKDMEDSYRLAQYLSRISSNLEGSFRTSVFQFRPYHGTKLYNIYVENSEAKDAFQENKILSNLIDRPQFNSYSKNFSECDDNKLYEYIYKTDNL